MISYLCAWLWCINDIPTYIYPQNWDINKNLSTKSFEIKLNFNNIRINGFMMMFIEQWTIFFNRLNYYKETADYMQKSIQFEEKTNYTSFRIPLTRPKARVHICAIWITTPLYGYRFILCAFWKRKPCFFEKKRRLVEDRKGRKNTWKSTTITF